jgi:hypothetical protein
VGAFCCNQLYGSSFVIMAIRGVLPPYVENESKTLLFTKIANTAIESVFIWITMNPSYLLRFDSDGFRSSASEKSIAPTRPAPEPAVSLAIP